MDVSSAKCIQKAWRNHQKLVNRVDVFTMEPLPDTAFRVFNYNMVYLFDHEALLQYILTTGNTKNPLNQMPFSDNTLRRLGKEYFGKSPTKYIQYDQDKKFTVFCDLPTIAKAIRIKYLSAEESKETSDTYTQDTIGCAEKIAALYENLHSDDPFTLFATRVQTARQLEHSLFEQSDISQQLVSHEDFKSMVAGVLETFANSVLTLANKSQNLASEMILYYEQYAMRSGYSVVHPSQQQYNKIKASIHELFGHELVFLQ